MSYLTSCSLSRDRFTSHFYFNESLYLLTFSVNNTRTYTAEINKDMEPVKYCTELDLNCLIKQNNKFSVFDNEAYLIEFLLEQIQKKTFSLQTSTNSLCLAITHALIPSVSIEFNLTFNLQRCNNQELLLNLLEHMKLLQGNLKCLRTLILWRCI